MITSLRRRRKAKAEGEGSLYAWYDSIDIDIGAMIFRDTYIHLFLDPAHHRPLSNALIFFRKVGEPFFMPSCVSEWN
jgi:hypothetical protein